MIASLTGQVERTSPGEVVVNVAGVGYRVHVPLSTYEGIPAEGLDCRLRVVTVVRDDEIRLYGFGTSAEEELFRMLQAVSGVGPKLALKILSGIATGDLRRALAQGDHRVLTSVSGVGKKLAERLVVELREKAQAGDVAEARGLPAGDRIDSEALQALEALGYPRKTAEQALAQAREGGASTLEDRVRSALRTLAPKR